MSKESQPFSPEKRKDFSGFDQSADITRRQLFKNIVEECTIPTVAIAIISGLKYVLNNPKKTLLNIAQGLENTVIEPKKELLENLVKKIMIKEILQSPQLYEIGNLEFLEEKAKEILKNIFDFSPAEIYTFGACCLLGYAYGLIRWQELFSIENSLSSLEPEK